MNVCQSAVAQARYTAWVAPPWRGVCLALAPCANALTGAAPAERLTGAPSSSVALLPNSNACCARCS
jgi:hypothetical protein